MEAPTAEMAAMVMARAADLKSWLPMWREAGRLAPEISRSIRAEIRPSTGMARSSAAKAWGLTIWPTKIIFADRHTCSPTIKISIERK